METIAKLPSPSYSSSGKFLGAGIAGLLPIRPLLPPFQGYLSKTIVCDGTSRSGSHLRSLAATASTTMQPSNGPTAQTPGHDSPSNASSIDRGGQPPLKQDFDVAELPVEIICEIFEKFMEGDSQPNREDPPQRSLIPHSCRSDPTILGWICSRWRAVAIGLPTLWSTICIHNPKSSQIHLVNTWLARSANSPLYLKFGYNWNDDITDLRAAPQILTSFISRLESWREIDFDIPLHLLGAFSPMVKMPRAPLLLQSAVLGFNPYVQDFVPHIDAIWKVLHASPNLRHVDWAGHGAYNFPTHAPFHQLTHVKTNYEFSVDGILAFLTAVPLIEELCISTINLPSVTVPDPGVPPLLLQHLRVLIVYSRSITTCSLFSSLTCPSLQSLRLKHHSLTDQPDQNLSELIPFLRRSTCQLHTLELIDRHLSEPILENLLQSPNLCSLKLLRVSMDFVRDKIIHLLTDKSEQGSHRILPQLEKLILDICETTDGFLATMISSHLYNDETSLGSLRRVKVTPRKAFRPIDNHFFHTDKLYLNSESSVYYI
ncbi:hypothetical protein M413DRAFT_251029 [Hebeloma cylindrosporum]|uniref:Uncharacterized protein n=1 Tax=Hebeloma cylindrosporum TaxID=76867 RepID=A0A0C2Y9X8_HEBCY|nr:hypothetical protein M413DRAFT_251029 [Hebeloma cylindrosporum h7]